MSDNFINHRFLGKIDLAKGKKLYVFHNNFNDLYFYNFYYGVKNFRDTISLFLRENGFQIVVFLDYNFNIIFADESMRSLYEQVTSGRSGTGRGSTHRRQRRSMLNSSETGAEQQPENSQRQPGQVAEDVAADAGGDAGSRRNTLGLLTNLLKNGSYRSAVIVEHAETMSWNNPANDIEKNLCNTIKVDWVNLQTDNIAIMTLQNYQRDLEPVIPANTVNVHVIEILNPARKEIEAFSRRLFMRHNIKIDDLDRFFLYCKNRDLRQIVHLVKENIDITSMQVRVDDLIHPSEINNDPYENLTWDELILPDSVKQRIQQAIEHVKNPEKYLRIGLKPPKGILFTGPPGTGKTTIARVLAANAKCSFESYKENDIKGDALGTSGQNVKRIFNEARSNAPTILFFDELDEAFPARDTADTYLREAVSNFLGEVDGVGTTGQGVFVIGASNFGNRLDPAVLSRFEQIIEIPLPGAKERLELLELFTRKYKIASDVDKNLLTEELDGFSGRDIENVCQYACRNAQNRITSLQQVQDIEVTQKDFFAGLDMTRQKMIEMVGKDIPIVPPDKLPKFDQIAGYQSVKKEVGMIIKCIRDRKMAKEYGIEQNGILFYGIPGNGKTFFTKAIAGEFKLAYMPVNVADIGSPYVDQSSMNLNKAFEQAAVIAKAVGCLLFFDEFDAIARKDCRNEESVKKRNVILQNLVNYRGTKGLVMVAATNFLNELDEATIRNGRFDAKIELPNPDLETRRELFRFFLQSRPCQIETIDIKALANVTSGCIVSDVEQICKKASFFASERKGNINNDDMEQAVKDVIKRDMVSPSTPSIAETIGRKAITIRELDVSQLYEQLNPAIIQIYCRSEMERGSMGTGFFIASSGMIATALHVVADIQEILGIYQKDMEHLLTLEKLQVQAETDLAILRVRESKMDFPTLALGQASDVSPGSQVVSLGFSHTSLGDDARYLIAHITRNAQSSPFIETDGEFDQGFSGGPLLNAKTGKVMGVISRKEGQGCIQSSKAENLNSLIEKLITTL